MKSLLPVFLWSCLAGLAIPLLDRAAAAQAAPSSPASHPAADRSADEIRMLREQMHQMRQSYEQQMRLLEQRLDALEAREEAARGGTVPAAPPAGATKAGQPPASSSSLPASPAAPQNGAGQQTSANQQNKERERAEAHTGTTPLYQNSNQTNPMETAGPSREDDAEHRARQQEARTKEGAESGKTPVYENLNDKQNPVEQQAKAFEFHGYLRSGVGINSEGGQQVNFQAPGAPGHYRLGNEPNTYGEFILVNNWVNPRQAEDHAWFHTEILISALTSQAFQGDTTDSFNLKEAFVRGGHLVAEHPDWKFWAGERYYRRWNIDALDWYMQDMSGYGGGVEDVHLAGPVKFAFAYMGGALDTGYQLNNSGNFYKSTFDLDWYGLRGRYGDFGGRFYYATAKGGTLQQGNLPVPGAHGIGVELGHNFPHLLGGNDRSVVQYATGEAANFYTTTLTPEPWIKDATGLRLTNQLLIQPHDPYERFSIFASTVYQRYKSLNAPGAVDSWISFGGRPQWYFTNHINVALDAGADHVIEGSQNYSGWLRKVTLAPEISAGRGYYSRPAVRLFVTYASWTQGFKGLVGGPAYLGLREGLTAGLQFEDWW